MQGFNLKVGMVSKDQRDITELQQSLSMYEKASAAKVPWERIGPVVVSGP